MTRQEGFYWVKRDGDWLIAEWEYGDWYVCGVDYTFADTDFEEINETRIVNIVI